MADDLKADFCIKVDYQKNSTNPARIFKYMSALLDNLQEIDHILVQSVDTDINPILLLEDIESGSIKTWLNQKVVKGLQEVDDEALKNLDWKQQVGKYLVKGKYLLIDFIQKKTQITDANEVKELQSKLLNAASESNIGQLSLYTPITVPNVIKAISLIVEPSSYLEEGDTVSFQSEQGDSTFNAEFNFSPDSIEELFVKEVIESNSTMILKIKKPDYLGTSMWEFKHERKNIQARILDAYWLRQFQNRQIDIRPGDSIRAQVKTSVKYGYDYDVVSTAYEIIKIIAVINSTDTGQFSLLRDDE